MAQTKDNKKKSTTKSTASKAKKVVKKATTEKASTKVEVKKDVTKKVEDKKQSKIAKLGTTLISSYEEPKQDKSVDVKKLMNKEDSPKMKIITQNRKVIIAFIVGLAVGLIIMTLFIPKRIATLADGKQVIVEIGDKNITSDDLYIDMKKNYAVNELINKIDDIILSEKYPENNDMKTSVNETADYYISMYETSYGYTEEQFLKANGFKTHDEFITYLTLDYRRNEFYTDYVKGLISDKDIKAYYDSKVYGDISTKYISIDASTDKDKAKALATEIIDKLNKGAKYDDVVSKYKDKIKNEDLSYISFNNTLEDSYVKALKDLKDNSYTKDPVEGTKDYKIIFRGDQKEKASLDDTKDKIIDSLVADKKGNDKTLYYKALDSMRKENKVSIKDTDLNSKYNDYIKQNTVTDTTANTNTANQANTNNAN